MGCWGCMIFALQLALGFLSPLLLAYKIAFKLKSLFWTEVTLLKGGQRCIGLGVGGWYPVGTRAPLTPPPPLRFPGA